MVATESIIKLGSFFTSIALSVALVGLSITQLIRGQDTTMYTALLSSTVSIWLPSPIQFMTASTSTTKTTEEA